MNKTFHPYIYAAAAAASLKMLVRNAYIYIFFVILEMEKAAELNASADGNCWCRRNKGMSVCMYLKQKDILALYRRENSSIIYFAPIVFAFVFTLLCKSHKSSFKRVYTFSKGKKSIKTQNPLQNTDPICSLLLFSSLQQKGKDLDRISSC